MVAAAALLAAAAPQLAGARPPVLFHVGRTLGNQPTARWSLPEGVRAFEICFQAVGAGGSHCWSSHDTYFAPQTERLRKGAYTVYVLGHDSLCQSCPQYERSNSLTLVIPAAKPTLRSVKTFSVQRGALRGAATLSLCDSLGVESPIDVVIRQARLRQGRLLASRENTSSWTFGDESGGGCGPLPVRWRIPPALARRGDTYRVTFSVVSIDGGITLARQLRW